jgi:hypothetical protein
MDGYGKLYYQSGKIAYEGNWHDDQFQGFGKKYFIYRKIVQLAVRPFTRPILILKFRFYLIILGLL